MCLIPEARAEESVQEQQQQLEKTKEERESTWLAFDQTTVKHQAMQSIACKDFHKPVSTR